MMRGIKGVDTKPELTIRSGLHKRGYRFRLHDKSLPGKPDLVLKKYNAVIFVNGCFWHKHDCHLFKWPKTRRDFWRKKIEGNAARDEKNIQALLDAGWRVMVIWECALKGKTRRDETEVLETISAWFECDEIQEEIAGA
jgi:DNA mismatch endonuclease (patch repair protein)